MPTYEYLGTNPECELCGSIFEVVQSIRDDPLKSCPQCGNSVGKQVSLVHGYIVRNREANQFSDIKQAKYWRDKNGVRHRVTPSDGSSKSATVTKQTNSPEQVSSIKKRDAIIAKNKRQNESLSRQEETLKRQIQQYKNGKK